MKKLFTKSKINKKKNFNNFIKHKKPKVYQNIQKKKEKIKRLSNQSKCRNYKNKKNINYKFIIFNKKEIKFMNKNQKKLQGKKKKLKKILKN